MKLNKTWQTILKIVGEVIAILLGGAAGGAVYTSL